MVFRALNGQLYLTLHSPNEHLKEHPCFIPLEDVAGRLTPKYILPDWFAPLQSRLHKMADELTASLTSWHGSDATFRPEDFGLVPSEKATRAIQSAIDKAGEHGGTVRLSGGDYVSGTLILRSNVRLMVDSGSRLLASTDLADYPEQIARRLTVQDTNMGMNQSLIFAEGCENICICGGGELDGQGTRTNFPGDETCHGTPGRPFLMRIVDCRNVHVHDITLRSAACWMENYLNCDRVLLERVTVRNQTNYNNDGIDIDGCRDVIIRNCDVESGDDACCFKGASERNTERVLIENCRLYSCCNALKVGTDTQGDFRDVLVRNCQIGGVEYDPSGLKHRCSDSGVSLEMVHFFSPPYTSDAAKEKVLELAQLLKAEGYDLWIYSGYLFEDLMAGHPHEKAPDLLALCDVLVDGPFVEALHSYDLNWAGSSNQRVIDLPATLKSGEVVLWKQDTIDFEAPSSW